MGWWTDYPGADNNFSVRLAELTRVARQARRRPPAELRRRVAHRSAALSLSDALHGGRRHGGVRATRKSRTSAQFFLKGGFLWVDDFWGPAAWNVWVAQIVARAAARRVPDLRHPDRSSDHAHAVRREGVPQVPSINFWYRSGRRSTSERGADSAEVHFRGIQDAHGRLMVLDVAQHRHRRHVGARGREPRILRSILAGRLRHRRERHSVRHDPLRCSRDRTAPVPFTPATRRPRCSSRRAHHGARPSSSRSASGSAAAGFYREPPKWATPADFDGSFLYCRGFYRSAVARAGRPGLEHRLPGRRQQLLGPARGADARPHPRERRSPAQHRRRLR